MGLWRVVLWIFSVSLQKAESPHAGIGMYVHCRFNSATCINYNFHFTEKKHQHDSVVSQPTPFAERGITLLNMYTDWMSFGKVTM